MILNILNPFKKKLKSDRGDSVLTSFLILAVPFIMIGAIGIDVSKNMFIRSNFIDMAQHSTQAAVKTVNSNGSLDWTAAEALVREYDEQRLSIRSAQQGQATTDETFSRMTTECDIDTRNGDRALPYYEITLDTERLPEGEKSANARTVSFSGAQMGSADYPDLLRNETYRVINVVIHESTPNFMLGIAGLPCQYFKINTSAIAFGENSDL